MNDATQLVGVDGVRRVAEGIGWPSLPSPPSGAPVGWQGARATPRTPDVEVGAPDEESPEGRAAALPVSRETDSAVEEPPSPASSTRESATPEEGDSPVLAAVTEDAEKRARLASKTFPRPDRPRIITVSNQKGGVGKTTTAVNLAAALAQNGLNVVLVDTDPQGNASTALNIDHHAEVPSIYDVLVDGTAMSEVLQPCPDVDHLWCVPATIDLAGAEIELVSLVARESRMRSALAALLTDGAAGAVSGADRIDYVIIDCPPSLGLLTVNAFVAAHEVLIPIQCEYYALEGLSQLLSNIDLIRTHLNPELHVSTILLTMYDGRTNLSRQVAEEVREHFPDEVLAATVPRSVRVSEAPSFGQTVITYDPQSSGALSYLEAAAEIADRGSTTTSTSPGTPIEDGSPTEEAGR